MQTYPAGCVAGRGVFLLTYSYWAGYLYIDDCLQTYWAGGVACRGVILRTYWAGYVVSRHNCVHVGQGANLAGYNIQ